MKLNRIKPGQLAIQLGCISLSALALLACGGGGTGAPAATTTTATTTTTTTAATPNGVTSTGTINATLAKTYSLKFFKGSGAGCGTVCTYTEGQSVSVVVGADGSLTLGTLKLTSPFYRKFGGVANVAEIIWLDGAANVEYALTNNTSGVFNEINVGDASKPALTGFIGVPGFIGQIR